MKKISTLFLFTSLSLCLMSQTNAKLEVVWEQSKANANFPAYLTTDSKQRSMTLNGEQLMIANQSGDIDVVNTKDGTTIAKHKPGLSGWGAFNGVCKPISDEIIMHSGLGSTVIKVYKMGADGKSYLPYNGTTADGIPLNGKGRIDFLSAYGDFSTPEGGFLIGTTVNTSRNLMLIPVANSSVSTDKVKFIEFGPQPATPGQTSGFVFPISKSEYLLAAKEFVPMLIKENGTVTLLQGDLPAAGASGVTYFEMNGQKFFAAAESLLGQFSVFEVTNGWDKSKKVATYTSNIGTVANVAYICPIVSKTEENQTMIYNLAPNNGLGAYKFTVAPTGITKNRPDAVDIFAQSKSISVDAKYAGTISIYSLSGQLQKKVNINEGLNQIEIEQGVYIVVYSNSTERFSKKIIVK